jgi:ATP-dependent Clp protease protease subunit
MKKPRKDIVKMAIAGEIDDRAMGTFLYGTSLSPDPDGFLDNDGPNTVFDITLSSPGGDIDVGVAMFEMLRSSKAEVNITGYGCVGSTAVLIFMAGHKRTLTPGTQVFMHPGTIAIDPPESIFTVEAKTKGIIQLHDWYCEQLANRSGCDYKIIYELCKKDTFLTAAACKHLGIATHLKLYAP